MDIIKIASQKLVFTRKTGLGKTNAPFFDRPVSLKLGPPKGETFNVILVTPEQELYSWVLNAVLQTLDFDISKIQQLKLSEGVLSFTTEFGKYETRDLTELNMLS